MKGVTKELSSTDALLGLGSTNNVFPLFLSCIPVWIGQSGGILTDFNSYIPTTGTNIASSEATDDSWLG